MTKLLRDQTDRLAREMQADAPADTTGWSEQQKLVWAARNGGYEAVVAKANDGWRPATAVAEEREPERGDPAPPVEAAPSSTDREFAQAPPREPEPQRQPEYWEEKCQWRHRGANDWDDRLRGYEYEYEYDPLEEGWREIMRSSR